MPDANLDPDVPLDAISSIVDDVRATVHEALGSRTYRVEIVTRRWSGDAVGVGTAHEHVLEFKPRPLVARISRDRLGPAGREQAGDLRLTEVSLSYSTAELQPVVDPAMEVAYRVTDTAGQGQKPMFYVLAADPVSRRGDRKGDNSDWYIVLHETAPMTELDGVDG